MDLGYRLWRLRKQNQNVDAHLRDFEGGRAGAEIDFLYNAKLAYKRRCPTRAAALAEAAAKRAELERDGWTAHW